MRVELRGGSFCNESGSTSLPWMVPVVGVESDALMGLGQDPNDAEREREKVVRVHPMMSFSIPSEGNQ